MQATNLSKKYYYERLATLATNPAPNKATAFTKEDSRAFQGFIDRQLGGISDTASVNSKNTHYPMGGIKVRKAPQSLITGIKWTMPFSLATRVITAVLKSPEFSNCFLFALSLSELGARNTFQVVPNRDLKRHHKDVDAIEVHSSIARSDKGQQCWMLGAGLKNTVGMLYVLDSSKVETMGDLPLLNSLANSLFFYSCLVMFQGASGALIQLWEGKGIVTPRLSTPSANSLWPKLRGDAQTPAPLVVDVAAPKDELLLNVQIVASLLGECSEWSAMDAISDSESLYRVTYTHERSCAIAQDFLLAGIQTRPVVRNPDLRHTLFTAQQIDSTEDEPNFVRAI